ncbi:hypothetical protein [Runella zeae]|uniref:hypothetical protein n=1 Tax=Runella zeae TaxID=94255 RepID=UPI002356C99F|nr:hypothetical protein [Runella zeae]
MLTVTNYALRKSQEGNSYFVLELTSDEPEMVLSRATNRYYITARKCYMSSTLNEAICKKMVGKEFVGSIIKVACEPYEFTVPETGEVITREHRYEYSPIAEGTAEQAVFGTAAPMQQEQIQTEPAF